MLIKHIVVCWLEVLLKMVYYYTLIMKRKNLYKLDVPRGKYVVVFDEVVYIILLLRVYLPE